MRVLNSIVNFSNHLVYKDICSLAQDPDYRAIDLQYREDMNCRLLFHDLLPVLHGSDSLPLNEDDPYRSRLQVLHFPRYEEISQQINAIFASHINSIIAEH